MRVERSTFGPEHIIDIVTDDDEIAARVIYSYTDPERTKVAVRYFEAPMRYFRTGAPQALVDTLRDDLMPILDTNGFTIEGGVLTSGGLTIRIADNAAAVVATLATETKRRYDESEPTVIPEG